VETIEEVWAGDLFNRQREANELIGYLESVAGRPAIREDGHAHVLAVDTAYGHGKTFFLKRLDRHLRSTDHVSAYVDAWMDDLEDQPMVALAATLDDALQPWAAQSTAVATGLAQFKKRAGRVAKIVGIGLAKRGAGFLITQGAAEALGDELSKANEITRDITKDALKESGKAAVDDFTDALQPVNMPSMETRIERFREGQAAIQAMKDSLALVVQALVDAGMKLPITIIVDELDRCRPTYAIKVLEEIKHLFDVSGVAFLLGLHGGQLEHSVTAAYGPGFDGASYLRRFFSRRYSLRPVSLQPLIQNLIESLSINERLLNHPSVIRLGTGRAVDLPKAELISDYLYAYGLAARDAFGVMESLHTAMALTRNSGLQVMYLLPLIISRHLGKDGVRGMCNNPKWALVFSTDPFGRDMKEYPLIPFVDQLSATAQLSDTELSQKSNAGDIYARIVVEGGYRNASGDYHLLQNYHELIKAVGRFS
jgi:hypothetical protein